MHVAQPKVILYLTSGTCPKKKEGLKLFLWAQKSLLTACPSKASGSELWESTNQYYSLHRQPLRSIVSDDGFVIVFGPSQSSFQSSWTQVMAYLCMSSLDENRELKLQLVGKTKMQENKFIHFLKPNKASCSKSPYLTICIH